MTELSKKIIEQYQVRKTGKQKRAFREMLLRELGNMGVEAREEQYMDLFGTVNVIAGDVEKAEMIFGAHYDTCPRMPFPNFITPKNKLVYYGYQMLIVCAILIPSLAVALWLMKTVSEDAGRLAWFILYFGELALMMKGPANPHTMNDNTSGVVTMVELMAAMPEELRSRCAFVLFDNEELGLVGSGAFRKKHKKQAAETPMVNLDCVGDGEYLLLSASRDFREDEKLYAALKNAFGEGEEILYSEAEKTVYNSDQKKFKKSTVIAALHKRPGIGYYLDRIHTVRDTVLQEENIRRIAAGLAAMTGEYFG